MDSPQTEPQRLSALYQYHNAPEVAPAHGLEYDDTVYPSSDKYPVIREAPSYDPSNYKGKHAFPVDNRPPRIIFGMKVRTFFVVAAIMIMVVVGAAVGGAVGGQDMHDGETDDGTTVASVNATATSSATPSATSSTSTYSAPTPTYTALSDCPNSNNTFYSSGYASGSSGTVGANAGLNFTKYCDLSSPLSESGASTIAEAFVYSFSDCVEVCAGYNFWNDNSNCTVAVYQPSASRPGNCWVGTTKKLVTLSSLKTDTGTDVAVLDQL